MKLLLVDDDPEMLLLVAMVLRRPGGFETVCVEDPSQVCAHARSERPDAILMDLLMEPIDGTEVLAQLAADPQTRHIPVIFLTGRAEPEEVERLCRLGAIGVIAKPIKPATLVREIAAMLECAAPPRRPTV
jgi:CheY-like chemotaxis protein